MNLNRYIILLVGVMSIIQPLQALAMEIEGKKFSERIRLDNTSLELVGAGLLRYFGIKAYAGALYIEQGFEADDVFSDTAKRIEIEYMRPIKGSDFGPATVKSLKKNIDEQTLAQLQERIEYHNSLYVDVQPGDRYALTYIPGRGTELSLNGESLGVIEGADFAAAIFKIWVGSRPISESFKKQILGLT